MRAASAHDDNLLPLAAGKSWYDELFYHENALLIYLITDLRRILEEFTFIIL